ncbi:MAG: discoidin domain-containing protein [Phycisphaerae bacterium]|nr:discoidin domain-containing protein [Phycisphaerae bacterium]
MKKIKISLLLVLMLMLVSPLWAQNETANLPDPASIMPPDATIYMEIGSPGEHFAQIFDWIAGKEGGPMLADIELPEGVDSDMEQGLAMVNGFMNPAMRDEFSRIKGFAIGANITIVDDRQGPVINGVAVLYPGQSNMLKMMLQGFLGSQGKAGDKLMNMSTMVIANRDMPFELNIAYDNDAYIFATSKDTLSGAINRYKGNSSNSMLNTDNAYHTGKLNAKNRKSNLITFRINGKIYRDILTNFRKMMKESKNNGRRMSVGVAEMGIMGFADIDNLDDMCVTVKLPQDSAVLDIAVNYKDGHQCLALDLLRMPALTPAGFEAVPADTVGMISFALGQANTDALGQTKVGRFAGMDILRELFANINQITIFMTPPVDNLTNNDIYKESSTLMSGLGLAITSDNPAKTRQVLSQLLAIPDAAIRMMAAPNEPLMINTNADTFTIAAWQDWRSKEDRKATISLSQVGSSTVIALEKAQINKCLSACRTRKNITTGPLAGSIASLNKNATNAVLVDLGGASKMFHLAIAEHENLNANQNQAFQDMYNTLKGTNIVIGLNTSDNSMGINYAMNNVPSIPELAPIIINMFTAHEVESSHGSSSASPVATPRNNVVAVGGKTYTFDTKCSMQYDPGFPKALMDGKTAIDDYTDMNWIGFEVDDLNIKIDLGSPRMISSIEADFLADSASWIYLPKQVVYMVSTDGRNWRNVTTASFVPDEYESWPSIKNVKANVNSNVRYLWVIAKNTAHNPDWHSTPGGDAWLFIDEITIK